MQVAELPALKTVEILPRARPKKISGSGKFALTVLLFIVGGVLFGQIIWQLDPLEQNIAQRLQNPSWEHPFGTDQFGRDNLARLLLGGRWSLLGALTVCIGTSLIGFLIGATAASNQMLDKIISRLIEAMLAIPSIVTALALTAILGKTFVSLLLALILTNWAWYARTYRSLVLKERGASYIEGSTAMGVSARRKLFRHILPNIIGPAVVIATANFGSVILNLSALSFLGLGMQPPTPEWGSMINESRAYFQRSPWQMVAPGLCIALTVLSINLLGDALRDLLDPRTKSR
jgi:ABC-type dipeptide/oligopeptide/nickel transport system permease subunit